MTGPSQDVDLSLPSASAANSLPDASANVENPNIASSRASQANLASARVIADSQESQASTQLDLEDSPPSLANRRAQATKQRVIEYPDEEDATQLLHGPVVPDSQDEEEELSNSPIVPDSQDDEEDPPQPPHNIATLDSQAAGDEQHSTPRPSDALDELQVSDADYEKPATPEQEEEQEGITLTPIMKRRERRADRHAYFHRSTPKLSRLLEVTEPDFRPTNNISRWNHAIGPDGTGLKVLNVVLPTRVKGRIRYMRDLLRAPVVKGRRLAVESITFDDPGKRWHFKIIDNNLPKRQRRIHVSGRLFEKALVPDEDAAATLGERLCRYLERLPTSLLDVHRKGSSPPSKTFNLVQIIVFADLSDSVEWIPQLLPPTTPVPGFDSVIVHGGKIKSNQGKLTSRVSVITDKSKGAYTYAQHNLSLVLQVDALDMSVVIPKCDKDLAALWPDLFGSDYLRKFGIPEDQHDRYIRAGMVLRYVQTQMYGAIGSLQEISKVRDNVLRPFILKHHRTSKGGMETKRFRNRIYNRSTLVGFDTTPLDKEFSLRPSRRLAKDIRGKLPSILIKSASRTRIAFVIQKLMVGYYSTGDVLSAWRTACEAADSVSASLISSDEIKRIYCQCEEHERQTTLHTCQSCLENELCFNMERNVNDCFVCRSCNTDDVAKTDSYNNAAHGSRLREQLHRLLKTDNSIAKKDRVELGDLLWLEIEKFRTPNDRWQDFWAAKEREERVESGRYRRQHPLALSFDAILPLSVSDDKILYHANPKNMCLTAAYINRLKGLYFPIILGHIRMLADVRTSPTDQDYDAMMHALINRMDHLYVKTGSYKFKSKVSRSRLDVNLANTIIEQMKHPIATQEEVSLCFSNWRKMRMASTGSGSYHRGWSNEEQETIDQMIGQIERSYSKKIQRGQDGAPWLWIPFHMPKDWSWYDLWRAFASRLERMRYDCNAKWETIDNTVTLMLECVIQHVRLDGRDDFLSFPMTPFEKHPLRCSIGHRHHQQQMRTGFTSLYPRDLEKDYDESLSNILFESFLSNIVKWDHSKSECDQILRDIPFIHLSTDHYSVPFDCPLIDFDKVWSSKAAGKLPARVVEAEEDSDESDNDWTGDADGKLPARTVDTEEDSDESDSDWTGDA